MRTSFGQSESYREKVIYEEIFQLKYFAGWSFIEIYNLPVGLRRWFINRLIRQLKEEKENAKNPHK